MSLGYRPRRLSGGETLMKKIITIILMFGISLAYSYTNEPTQVIGIHKGQTKGFKNIKVASTTPTCVISTGTENIAPGTDWIIKSDEENSSNIYSSTSPLMITCVPITATTDGIFLQTISTTTLKAATTVWTTQILIPSPFTNVTAAVTYTVGTATAVFAGTCTITGIDDTYATVTEYIDISTTTATGSKIWTCITSISWKATTVVGPPVGMQQPSVSCEVGTGSKTSDKTVGNVWILHPGESLSVDGIVRDQPLFLKTKETNGVNTVCIMETETSH